MNLDLYSDELFCIQIDRYILGQMADTDTPHNLVNHSVSDKERFAVAISDEAGKLVGFLGIHIGAGPEAYGYVGGHYALVRDMSIDERFRGRGYGVKCFDRIFEFIHEEISDEITTLILGVHEKNIPAQKAYEKAAFIKREEVATGKKGKLIIMEKCK